MKNIKWNLLIAIILIFTIIGCASFTKRKFRKQLEYLHAETISKIDGNYSYHPIKRLYNSGKQTVEDFTADSLVYNNAYDFIINKTVNRKVKAEIEKKFANDLELNLKLENNNLLRIKVIEQQKIVKDTTLTGKYRNGMFYLDNKYLECNGIPYLFGGCRNNKRRIGIAKNGNLLINEAINNEGAILLIIGGGYSGNVTFEYQKRK